MESKFKVGDHIQSAAGDGVVTYIHYVDDGKIPVYLIETANGQTYGLSEEDINYSTVSETHKPIRYEVLPGIQAWDILKPICNRFSGIMAGYIFNIGKYFLRIGMKDEVKKELMKMREYIDKAIEEVDYDTK